jgi:hypothetical protein
LPNRPGLIVSGGQTGVDRAALDAAIASGLACGGSVPAGREAEDGPIPLHYQGLTETGSADPAVRTRLNVERSDATLVLTFGETAGGTRLTVETAREIGKPVIEIDISSDDPLREIERVREWLSGHVVETLNVAGPRESEAPGIYDAAYRFLTFLFRN